MRRNNSKKKTIYAVLLIVVAILVVGYAVLSSTLNIFGGLSVVGGNNWGVRWDNIEISNDSTALASVEPSLQNDTRVDFQISLNTPGDFYEFNIDAENYGSINAMVEDISYKIYDADDNEVNPDFINYSVTYSNGQSIDIYHLLEFGTTATYKVRIEYNSDISPEELPSGTDTYRFEFEITYVQADENAIDVSLGSGKHMILIGDQNSVSATMLEDLFSNNYDVIFANNSSNSGSMLDTSIQSEIENLLDEYSASNIIVVIGTNNVNYAGIYAQTLTLGDPNNVGPLGGVELSLPVYHVFDPALESYYDYDVYNDEISPIAAVSSVDTLVQTVQTYRDQYSINHSL